MPQILGSSISYRIAVGPQQAREAFMIRTIRPLDRPDPRLERVAKANGFSLHAGVSCEGNQKEKVRAGTARETALGHRRERLCRYISRPAVAVPRLSLSSTGKVVYALKTPYRDGTIQVAFEPVDFVSAWPPWYQSRGSTSPATMAFSLQTTAGVGSSRPRDAGRASSLSPKQKSAHPRSAMPL